MIVVLFSTTPRDDLDVEAYRHTSARMRELVAAIPGFISYNTYTADSGEEIAVARFESEQALDALADPHRAPARPGHGPVGVLPGVLGSGVLDAARVPVRGA